MIRPEYKPVFRMRAGYWRVTPTGVWKQCSEAERHALRDAHAHAAKLNAAAKGPATTPAAEYSRILQEAYNMVNRHVELGRAKDADRWRAIVKWLRSIAPL